MVTEERIKLADFGFSTQLINGKCCDRIFMYKNVIGVHISELYVKI